MEYSLPFRDAPESGSRMGIPTPACFGSPPPSRGSSVTGDRGLYLNYQQQVAPLSPPASSSSGTPHLKLEELSNEAVRRIDASDQGLRGHASPQPSPGPAAEQALPSIAAFDRGVEAIARSSGPSQAWLSPSPGFVTRYGVHIPEQQPLPPFVPPSMQNNYQPRYSTHTYESSPVPTPSESTRPRTNDRHINKKYTTEQGDYIIYLWHEKKLKWDAVQREFALRFQDDLQRTAPGLQAWYYRENNHIPMWDDDGFLIFEDDETLEPRTESIKVRENNKDKLEKSLGLLDRFPERAMNYSWVDAECKERARPWAEKRLWQIEQRKQRKLIKERYRARL